MDLLNEIDKLIDAKLEELGSDENINRYIRDVTYENYTIANYIQLRDRKRKRKVYFIGNSPIPTVHDFVKETMQEMERRNYTHIEVEDFQEELKRQLIRNEERFEENKPFKVFRPMNRMGGENDGIQSK